MQDAVARHQQCFRGLANHASAVLERCMCPTYMVHQWRGEEGPVCTWHASGGEQWGVFDSRFDEFGRPQRSDWRPVCIGPCGAQRSSHRPSMAPSQGQVPPLHCTQCGREVRLQELLQ